MGWDRGRGVGGVQDLVDECCVCSDTVSDVKDKGKCGERTKHESHLASRDVYAAYRPTPSSSVRLFSSTWTLSTLASPLDAEESGRDILSAGTQDGNCDDRFYWQMHALSLKNLIATMHETDPTVVVIGAGLSVRLPSCVKFIQMQ